VRDGPRGFMAKTRSRHREHAEPSGLHGGHRDAARWRAYGKTASPDECLAGRAVRCRSTHPAPELCPRYTADWRGDVRIGPSTHWLQRRLWMSG